MDNIKLPRQLTAAEFAEIKAAKAREKQIYTDAGWFLPIPDGQRLSALGDKGDAYVNDALDILDKNQADLGSFIPLAEFQNADELHDQAAELEDLSLENAIAPHNVALIAGAVSKKFADDEYSVAKSFERLSTKWTAIVERLSARYKGQGPQTAPPKTP